MTVSLNNKTSFLIYKAVFQKFLAIGEKQMALSCDEISIAILPSKQMQTVNRTYRGTDSPTDVLAFDYGEILLCPAYIRKKHHLKTMQEVIQKMGELFIHGLAHIAGYTHETEEKEREMKAVEEKVMAMVLKEKIKK